MEILLISAGLWSIATIIAMFWSHNKNNASYVMVLMIAVTAMYWFAVIDMKKYGHRGLTQVKIEKGKNYYDKK